ncbi:MAG TPA: cytochrome c [Steroidobacter sp.]|uniref:c-type cytochrome n=1 Tax=Steroidobacter sp. TaxID=1978227 RepID=UPI002ED97BC6
MSTALRPLICLLLVALLSACASQPIVVSSFGIHATTRPEVIERGRYLVYGPAHCAECHGADLSGGREFASNGLFGRVIAPNLTTDPIAGLGDVSDDALVQSLRYGVSRHGRPMLPYMVYFALADDDLQAIVSFLRTVPAVPGVAPQDGLSALGRFSVQHLLPRQLPTERPSEHVEPGRNAEYGSYLADAVAVCRGCHTRRRWNGTFTGTPYAGGTKIRGESGEFIAPNLTPGPEGVLNSDSEQNFIDRFRRTGPSKQGSPMPWSSYARMSDMELGAIYRYLRSLPPG